MSSAFTMFCPHCGTRAKVRTSKTLSRTMREIAYQCDDVQCSHSFVGIIEVVRTISPSATPHPEVNLPMTKQAIFNAKNAHQTADGLPRLTRATSRELTPEEEKEAMKLWTSRHASKHSLSRRYGVPLETIRQALERGQKSMLISKQEGGDRARRV